MPKLSIIIPILNEQVFLANHHEILKSLLSDGHEILVIDGGSTDNSVDIAKAIGCKTLKTKTSRGFQLHVGAKHSKNELLLFLHADTLLPTNAAELIYHALTPVNKHWGRFNVRFSNQNLIFQIIAWFMNKRSYLSGIATGDQAIFVKRKSYFSCGGFPDFPIMEDIEISKRLKKIAYPVCIPNEAIASSRKWENQGVIITILKMWSLRLMFFFGVPTEKLAKLY